MLNNFTSSVSKYTGISGYGVMHQQELLLVCCSVCIRTSLPPEFCINYIDSSILFSSPVKTIIKVSNIFLSLEEEKLTKHHQLQESKFENFHKRWIFPLKSSGNNKNIYKISMSVGRNVRNYLFPLFRRGEDLDMV